MYSANKPATNQLSFIDLAFPLSEAVTPRSLQWQSQNDHYMDMSESNELVTIVTIAIQATIDLPTDASIGVARWLPSVAAL
jgi:hypothetical protein